MDYLKEFNCKLQALDRSKSVETVFRDFLTLSTCSLAQPFYRSNEIEQKYKYTVSNYTKEQANAFMHGIRAGGWATDLYYAEKNIEHMEFFDLYRFDNMTYREFLALVNAYEE